MTKLETVINTILQQLKTELANETWESRCRYFKQMLKSAKLLGITEPCAKLYDVFIADDNGSPERHALHVRCVKLLDSFACTQAQDEHGLLFNEPPPPDDTEVHEFFQGREFPITADVRLDLLIVKAEIEMRYLHLTDSTIGQYKHSWMNIRHYFYDAGVSTYDESLLKCFIQEINNLRNKGSMKEWKWKINRKAAHVLIEVANTGRFLWKRSMATTLPILRSQLAFFHTTGLISKNLSGIVMGCFVQRCSVAAYLSEKDQVKLIAQLAKESKRTKAVILLAMHLGLRDCDICNLTFQVIDWRDDRIRLIQKKTGEPLVLPLLSDVGNALMDYILNERPKRTDNYPYIFLRRQAPHQKLTSVYPICSRLLRCLGIKPVNGTATGVHLFRYSIAHKLLAAKVPHQVITDALGHTSKESDKPYLSMDESMLRMCALDLSDIGRISWKGGASND
jgi:integrase